MNLNPRWYWPVLVLLIGLGIVVLSWSAGRNDQSSTEATSRMTSVASPPVARDGSTKKGKKLYSRYCVTCHGVDGRGTGPAARHLSTPPLNFHGDTAARWSSTELFERISHGSVKTGMPAWETQISKRKRWHIVRYIERAFVRNRSDTAPLQ